MVALTLYDFSNFFSTTIGRFEPRFISINLDYYSSQAYIP